MTIVKPLYTAKASTRGGRTGRVTADGAFAADLSIPKEMGGAGKAGTINPEILFASGYSACFGSAVEHVARQGKLPVTAVTVDAAVTIGSTADGTFALKVALTATVQGVPAAEAERLVAEADRVCPYSNAIRGNVEVTIATRVG